MFSVLFITTMFLQATPAIQFSDDVSQPDIVKDLAAPPKSAPPPPRRCTCAQPPETPDRIISGLVVDAELTLGADRRSVNDRQATIFETAGGKERIRIFHSTQVKKCGLSFDYGVGYSVPVRKTEKGEFETDICLVDPDAVIKPRPQPSKNE